MNRWSMMTDGVHPEAIRVAKDLESHGFTQHEPSDLDDQEGVIVVHARDGGHAPARFFRRYKPTGAHGARESNVFETWPESPWAEPVAYDDTLVPVGDRKIPSMAIFRLNAPHHENLVAALYDGRARRHRDEATA